MKPFEYLSGFLILFQVVTLSEITLGIAYSLNTIDETRFFIPHIIYTVAAFLGTFDYVVRIYSYRKIEIWNYWKFTLAIIPGIIWLICGKLCFPNLDPPDTYNFEEVFNRNHFLLYSFSGVYLLIVSLPFVLYYKKRHWIEISLFAVIGLTLIVQAILAVPLLDYVLPGMLVVAIIITHIYRTPMLSVK